MKTAKLHLASGVIISIFVGLHLFNHFCSIYGAQMHIEVMEKLRPYYRNKIAEPILLLAVIVQIASGLKLFAAKRKTTITIFEKLHIYTGLYLAFFFIIHVGAVISGRILMNLDTNFYFGVAGLNTFPLNIFFVPYYGLAMFSFFGHLAAVHNKKMKKAIFGLNVKKQSNLILITGFLFVLIIFYGLTNKFSGVEIPEEYRIMIGR